MLAVDVSFLAVPNVNIQQSRSVGVIVSYVSIMFTTGSLIASLHLANRIQRYSPESKDGIVSFSGIHLCNANLSYQTRLALDMSFFGMNAFARIHSLPYAMLMWG